jgi:hypothetical protein
MEIAKEKYLKGIRKMPGAVILEFQDHDFYTVFNDGSVVGLFGDLKGAIEGKDIYGFGTLKQSFGSDEKTCLTLTFRKGNPCRLPPETYIIGFISDENWDFIGKWIENLNKKYKMH